MTLPEALGTTRIPCVAGRTGGRTASRPASHHRRCGADWGWPGADTGDVSRAHHGMLWLDARPACRRHVLEVLRQPLEMRGTLRPSYVRRRALGAGCAGAAPHAPRWRLIGSGTMQVLATRATRGVSLAHRSTVYPSASRHEPGALPFLEPSAFCQTARAPSLPLLPPDAR
jgi:magnesium chelatase subunit ChlI-like protein